MSDHETAKAIADRIHALNDSGKASLSLLLDTKWPELRTGDVSEKIQFRMGDVFRIYTHTGIVPEWAKFLTCDYVHLSEDVNIGSLIEIDSGLFHVRTIAKWNGFVEVEAENDALIGSRRHVNLPGVRIRLPGITDKDKEDILFGIQNGYHFIAASFIRTAENVREIRAFLDKNGGKDVRIISKIENEEGVENLEEIVKISDGIMVARGDLGIEVPIEKVPKYQKKIIDLCRQHGKFVIVATHMLESMIEFPFPTRAEVSDIFRAVLQGADATMLSGETTTGKYPLHAVEMMNKVIIEAEEELEHKHHPYSNDGLTQRDIEKKLLIRSALEVAEDMEIDTVILFTKSGRLARLAAAYRPNIEIHAFTESVETMGLMRLLFGIVPHRMEMLWDQQIRLETALQSLLDMENITRDSRVIAITDRIITRREWQVIEIITVADVI